MKKLLLSVCSAVAVLGATGVQAQNTINIIGTTWSLDTIYHAKVGPGTTQTHLELVSPSNSKLQVFYLTVDKTTPGVSMRAVCAKDMVAGTERPSAMAKRKSGNGVLYFAGTNGDFYSTSGTATNGSSKVGSPTTGCIVDREFYKTSNGNYQFSVDTAGVARVSRLYYYTGTATLGDKTTLFKGVNVASPNNGITIYTPKYWGSTNQTDKAGSCAEVTAKLVGDDKMYAGGKFRLEVTSTATNDGDTTIPSDGVVIHGRGTSTSGGVTTGALDFVNGLQVGDIVEFENVVLTEQGSTERIVPAQVVSGNPKNVGGGLTLDTEGERADASSLHPRTGIGVSQSGDSIIMMVVDGRSTISAGVRTSQLADIMRYAGAWEAVNLDGGGSSCLYTSALGVRNTGSDGSERAVGNGIFATITAPEDTEIAEIRFADWEKGLPQYSHYKPVIYGYNKYGVLIDTDLQDITLSCSPELGEVQENGTSLYVKGTGMHVLSATYGQLSADIIIEVDESALPEFKAKKIISDSYHDYKVEVFSVMDDVEHELDNTAFVWTSEDPSIAIVDENGVIKGVRNGTTLIRGVAGNFVGEIEVVVEVPTMRYQDIESELDVSTWTVSGNRIENESISKYDNGMIVNYTTTASKRVEVVISKNVTTWSRPDSLCLEINPGTAKIKTIEIVGIDPENIEKEVSTSITPGFEENIEKRLLIPISDLIDVTNMSTLPLDLSKIIFTPLDTAGSTQSLKISKLAWVYDVIPAESSGVECLEGDIIKNILSLSPNPVESGEVVKLNVLEPVDYIIYNVDGTVVAHGKDVEFSTSGMHGGVYIVVLNKKHSLKLIVK